MFFKNMNIKNVAYFYVGSLRYRKANKHLRFIIKKKTINKYGKHLYAYAFHFMVVICILNMLSLCLLFQVNKCVSVSRQNYYYICTRLYHKYNM